MSDLGKMLIRERKHIVNTTEARFKEYLTGVSMLVTPRIADDLKVAVVNGETTLRLEYRVYARPMNVDIGQLSKELKSKFQAETKINFEVSWGSPKDLVLTMVEGLK